MPDLVIRRLPIARSPSPSAPPSLKIVQHTGIRKRLALKLLRAEMVAMPDVLARFEREAMAAAHLEHPHVAAATDYGRTEDGRYYLVMEYIEGKELRDAMDEENGPMPPVRAFFIARQIATALQRAHKLGIVHRDLKPENIMLVKREGHSDLVKVLDFGLAQVPRQITEAASEQSSTANSKQLTKIGDIFGTPAYMSPEQTVGESTDIRTDLYSLGIILYEMLAGMRPFTGKAMMVLLQQHLTMTPPPIGERAPGVKVPKEVEVLVQRLLAKKPEERLSRPQDLLAEIDRIVATHKLVWSIGAASSRENSHSEESAVGQRIASISRAWTALRFRPATVLALSKLWNSLLLLRQNLRGPMQRVPRWLLISGAVLVAVLPAGIVFRALFGSKSDLPTNIPTRTAVQPPPAPVLLAPQGVLDTALAQGQDAMEALASRYPADARIQRALLRAFSSQRRHVEAMRVIAKLGALDPSAGSDSEVVKSIVAAVQGDTEAVEAAATLLEQDLGEAGVDLLYDLTVKQTGARWKPRLNQSLTKPEVLAKASPATRLALDMRTAKRCEAKRDLLPRIAQEGDRRALVQLKSLAQPQGCGFLGLQDCWPCLRKTSALQDAVMALESRTNESKQP